MAGMGGRSPGSTRTACRTRGRRTRRCGGSPIPDTWHGRMVTLDADWARFTEADYDEACSRLRRLGRMYVLRYEVGGAGSWDEPRDPAWTLRQIAEHVAGVTWYAEQVGKLA